MCIYIYIYIITYNGNIIHIHDNTFSLQAVGGGAGDGVGEHLGRLVDYIIYYT